MGEIHKVTVREFKNNLSRCLDLLEDGQVLEVRGINIMAVATLKVSGKATIQDLKENVATQNSGPVATPPEFIDYLNELNEKVMKKSASSRGHARNDGLECELCKKSVKNIYEIFEDGDEHYICEGCLKERHGKGWVKFKSYLVTDEPELQTNQNFGAPPMKARAQFGKFAGPMWKPKKKSKKKK